MSDFQSETGEDGEEPKTLASVDEGMSLTEAFSGAPTATSQQAISLSRFDFEAPLSMESAVSVVYCGICSLPCEYCIFGQRFDECSKWRESLDDETLASLLGCVSIESSAGGGKKGGIGPKKKAASSVTCKVIIAREQRQKRKYITSVFGLDTVPDLKVKDAAKCFGKKFSSGCSVSETATGQKEVVIQGDVALELPALLMKDFKVPAEAIFFLAEDKKTLSPYA